MKRTTFVIAAMCTAVIAGCNPMNRIGSQSATFDRDPFTQLDDANPQMAQQPPQSPAAGRVSVGNLNAPAPGAGYPNQAMQYADQQATSHASYSYMPQQPPASPPIQQAAVQTPPQQYSAADFAAAPPTQQSMSSPAARAAAEAAAILAQRRQQPIQQMSHTAHATQPPAVTNASFEADPFEALDAHVPNGTPGNGAVPMPPEAVYNPDTTQFELSDADLSLESANPTPPQNPNMFPGTNIPIPTGRATMMSSAMPLEWESEPTPQQPVEPIKVNPVFQPPAAPGGQVAPQQPTTGVPVIRDSTNQTKWRAVDGTSGSTRAV